MQIEPSDSMKTFPYGKTISLRRNRMKRNDLFSTLYGSLGILIIATITAYLFAIIYYKYYHKDPIIDNVPEYTANAHIADANTSDIIILDDIMDDPGIIFETEVTEEKDYIYSIDPPKTTEYL